MASSFFNLGSIVAGVGLGWAFDPHFGPRSLIGLSLGTLIGGLMQLVVQFPSLRRVGFRFRPDFAWRDDGVRQILVLMGPAIIAASAVQVNVMVNSNFASHLPGDGPVSWLNWAFRLMQLPLGIFGVAVGTVHDVAGVRSTLGHGIRFAFLLTIPCAVGLIFLAEPIISLIFQRGHFNYESTLQTAAALKFYAVGLVAYSSLKVLAPAFYALNKRNLPMIVSFFSIATNYLFNQFLTLHLHFGHRGLALSTSLVAILNFAILYVMMARHIDGLETRALLRSLGKLVLASLPLVLVCLAAQHWLFAGLKNMAFFPKITAVLSTITVGAAVFGAGVALLRVEETEDVLQMIRRKLGRLTTPASRA
jgi:putative peptidoglycan lipid II flippase